MVEAKVWYNQSYIQILFVSLNFEETWKSRINILQITKSLIILTIERNLNRVRFKDRVNKKKRKIRRERKWRETLFLIFTFFRSLRRWKSGENTVPLHLPLSPSPLSNLITAGFFASRCNFLRQWLTKFLRFSTFSLRCHRKPTGFTWHSTY